MFCSVLPMKWTIFSVDLMVLLFHVKIIVFYIQTNIFIHEELVTP